MRTQDEHISVADLGEDFKAWKLDPCTQALLERLEGQATVAREELINIDPCDRDKMYQAQNTVKVFLAMVKAIDGFIHEGNNAIEALRQQDEAPTD